MKKLNPKIKIGIIFLITLLSSSVLSGCAHSIHQYSVSDSYSGSEKNLKKGRRISADTEQFVILSFAFNTDYADQAYQMLLQNCPRGEILGINAKYSTSLGFLSYTNKMHLEGICIDST